MDANISDRYLMVFPVCCDVDHKVKKTKRLKVNALTKEEWEQRNHLLTLNLEEIGDSLAVAARQKNVENFHDRVEGALNEALADDKVQVKPAPERRLGKQFIKKHESHQRVAELRGAVDQNDGEIVDKLLDIKRVDGRRQLLATVKRSDARAFYAYLANADGRKRWGITPAESAPNLSGGACTSSKLGHVRGDGAGILQKTAGASGPEP